MVAVKWGREYSELVGFVRAKMVMAVVRAITLLLRGTRLKQPTWIPLKDGTLLEDFPGLYELCGAY